MFLKINFFIILIFFIFLPVKSDQIYELIKIPNLEVHKENKNGLVYLVPFRHTSAGVGINSVSCEKPKEDYVKEKLLLSEKNFETYNKSFLEKISLRYIILCKNLRVSDLPAYGFANPKMKTLILNSNTKKEIFSRVLHHEIFHIVQFNFNKYFDKFKWKNFNSSDFNYAECSTCSNKLGLKPLDVTNGFFTDYSKTTFSEDMAETFSFIMTYPKLVFDKIQNDNILRGKVFFIKNNLLKIDENFNFKVTKKKALF